ncbi:hypothetical protein [Candidatus Hodgkinia cicadicola]
MVSINKIYLLLVWRILVLHTVLVEGLRLHYNRLILLEQHYII